MKQLFTVAVLVLFAQVANSATLLKFRDGSANVWDNISVNGNQYCTQKSFGELCVKKQDVVLKKEVPEDTDPLEYGNVATTNLGPQSDSIGADEYAKMADQKRSKDAAEDRQRELEHKSNIKHYGAEKTLQMERSGNSAGNP